MSPFETLATVGDNGEIRIDGVPFAPGTAVDVVIQPVQPSEADRTAVSGSSGGESRAVQLFAALDKSRNSQSVANFHRDEIYDRNVLH